MAFVRVAILAFLPRLSQDRKIIYSIYVIGSLVFIQTIVAFVYRLTECTPVAYVLATYSFAPGSTVGLHSS